MKKYWIVILALLLFVPAVLGLTGSAAEEVGFRPFQVINAWGGSGNPYVYKYVTVTASMEKVGDEWVATLSSGTATGKDAAAAVKKELDKNPEGARYVRFDIQDALLAAAENVVYTDKSVPPLKKAFTEFFAEYKALGGVLDGVYTNEKIGASYGTKSPTYWYLHSAHYSGGTNNKDIYWEIVNNPLYESRLRPMLEERGFVFYPVNEFDPQKSEIFYIYPYTDKRYNAAYTKCFQIWDNVMEVMVAENIREAVFKPLMESFPDAIMADSFSRDLAGWMKTVGTEAGPMYRGGNLIKAGNASCYNTDDRMLLDGKTFPGYNGSSFAMTPFTQLMWDVNLFKGIYGSTDTGEVVAWVGDCFNNYQGYSSRTGYYTEMMYHLAMTNVDTFFGYFYNDRQQHVMASNIMAELNRILGAADRKPIAIPISWNSDFIISGMSAGGKNYWRITPNLDKVSITSFRVAGANPTFKVNNQTVTFSKGTVIMNGLVTGIGSCGYWVETAADVYPEISGLETRYADNPTFLEKFDSLNANIWHQHDGFPTASVSAGKLVLNGKTELRLTDTVSKITAGDSFAKEQAWEITVTVPADLDPDAKIMLLSYCDADGGFSIKNGKLWYDKNNQAVEFPGIDLSAGGTYVLKREVNMTIGNAYTSSYYVYTTAGKLLGQAEDVPAATATIPLTYLLFSSSKETDKAVKLDNLKLYPIGFTAQFEVYKASTGIPEETESPLRAYDLGYRLSYLNVTDETRKLAIVISHYDSVGNLVSRETVRELTVKPGTDGIFTGIARVKNRYVRVQLVEQEAPYITAISGGGSDAAGAGRYFPGETVTVDAGTRDGFRFAGWQVGNVTLLNQENAVTSFVMPEGNVTLTAQWVLAVEDGIRPFTMTNWGSVADGKFSNVLAMPQFMVDESNGVISWNGISDLDRLVVELKAHMDARPAGTRWLNFAFVGRFLRLYDEDIIYRDKGVRLMREWMEEFLSKYKAAGGKLDGLAQDMEYFDAESWFLRSWHYLKGETDIYKRIVENPLYKTRLRPKLEERGFQWYPANSDPNKPEIFSACYEAGSAYALCWKIWDAVSRNLMSDYMNECITEPLAKYYPYAETNDYTTRDVYGWTKQVDVDGSALYQGGNWNKTGHSSNFNTYSYAPAMVSVNAYGEASYKNPITYNKAIYEDDPYNMSLWDVNLFKYMYACTPEKRVSIWFGNYNYSPDRDGANSNTPYYAETILHAGLLDPQPFLGFICGNHRDNLVITDDYNFALQVASEILSELTRVVGAADRRPIELPISWNDGFMLSGMYAGGRNVWRITPDTDLVSLEDFKVSGTKDLTFSVAGRTVTFPGGKIIEDGHISEIGTCGYWVETATDVVPVISDAPDRFVQSPAFIENFEAYASGIDFTNDTALPKSVWKVSGTGARILTDRSGNQVLSFSGTTALENVKATNNITAADGYAKQQSWQITVNLPAGLASNAELKLLYAGKNDGGIKISGGKVYYAWGNTYQEMEGVNLTNGTFTLKREMDFRSSTPLCSYYVYNAAGAELGKAENIRLSAISTPVASIAISCTNADKSITLDNYKLMATGCVIQYEVYDVYTGLIEKNQNGMRSSDTAFRLSWYNAESTTRKGAVVATFYNSQGTKVSEKVIRLVEMAPGTDGVEVGIVKNTAATMKVAFVEDYNVTTCDVKVVGGTAGVTSAKPGTTVTLKANAAPAGKVFDRWFIETDSCQFFLMADPTKSTTTFTMPAGMVSVRALYKDAPYTVKAVTDAQGTVTGAGSYDVGTEAALQAIAMPGYKFAGWKENGQLVSTANPYYFPAANRTLTATFERISYTVTVEGGTSDRANAGIGLGVTVTADKAPTAMQFDKWEVVMGKAEFADVNAASTQLFVESNVVIKATYKEAVYAVAVEGGTADAEGYKYGADVTVTLGEIPVGKVFKHWEVVSGEANVAPGTDMTQDTISFKVYSDVTVKAVCEDIYYTVTVIDGIAITETYKYGDVVNIQSGMRDGFKFDGWTSEDAEVVFANAERHNTSFTMPARDVTVTGTWVEGVDETDPTDPPTEPSAEPTEPSQPTETTPTGPDKEDGGSALPIILAVVAVAVIGAAVVVIVLKKKKA